MGRSVGDSYLQRTDMNNLKLKVPDMVKEIIVTKRKYFSCEYLVNG